jgi:hypothetical protein
VFSVSGQLIRELVIPSEGLVWNLGAVYNQRLATGMRFVRPLGSTQDETRKWLVIRQCWHSGLGGGLVMTRCILR